MKKIGRYLILGRLGRGGMSTVYKAQAPVTKRTVALKILQPRDDIFVDLVGEERLREIFMEEARIMGGISHDHVAKIIDCDEDAPFIVLEYFAHSLGTIIGEGYRVENPSRIVSINKAFTYACQTLRGLERLHFAGIIHRDIKPFNLMITNDDRIKIIDFGLSRVRGEEKMKIPGMQVGSPYYTAPEQEKNPEKADERADLFSVGIMLYRMVTGQLISSRQKDIIPPSQINMDLTPEWDQFIHKSIRHNPKERYKSARDMRLQLEYTFHNWARNTRLNHKFTALDQVGPSTSPITVRSTPAFIRYNELKHNLGLDLQMRPEKYIPHRFEFRGIHLLYCIDTGILWQKEGAGFTLTWEKAHEYTEYLNVKKWHDRDDWRLPTVEELFTLLRPPTISPDFCFDSYFPPDIHWLWSSDTCTKKKAWMADISEGYFQQLDKDGNASVCAVSSG